MDSLKFAFDTLIVGALALPWLVLFVRMFFEQAPAGTPDNQLAWIGPLPEHTREAVASVLVFALGYFLGSAVTRISNNLFDDELWRVLPTESAIRASVYAHEYCDIHVSLKKADLNLPLELGHATKAEDALCAAADDIKQRVVTELFRTQESRLLLAGEDKIARLKEYHDQIIILRGSILNGTVLLVLSGYGICACYRAQLPGGRKRLIWYTPAFLLLAYGLFSLCLHLLEFRSNTVVAVPYHAPPLAEFVLILFGITGFADCRRTEKEDLRLYRNVWVLALVLSTLAYGGWWWTEVMYDNQVIHSNLQNTNIAR
jgi:hypothetical protein